MDGLFGPVGSSCPSFSYSYSCSLLAGGGASEIMNTNFPQFDLDEVALLITAVQKALERLKVANEARGGNDPEFLEYGRRYSVILQKLESIAGHSQR